ncbi:MAG: AMP-binding protein [Clostridia bacterium]|nr:AMP-binding protein [Clostridia bacterium]
MSDYRDQYWYTDIREISTFNELLTGTAAAYPYRPALWVKGKKQASYKAVNYTLFKHDVACIGTKLREMGLQKEKIGVVGVNSYEWIVTYLAVTIGGGVVVPLDKEFGPAEISNLMKTAGCSTIFYTSDQKRKIEEADGIDIMVEMQFYGDRTDIEVPASENVPAKKPVTGTDAAIYSWRELLADGEKILEKDEDFYEHKVDPDALSILLFTSGTTGTPKGVMLSQRNVVSNIMDTCRIAEIKPSDKALSILPIHHTYECTYGMLLMFYRGGSTAFCEGLKYITANMKEARCSVLIAVPLINEMIYKKIWKSAEKQGKTETLKKAIKRSNRLKAVGIDISRILFKSIHRELGGKLRLVITGAAAISPNVCRGFEDIGIRVLQGYGLTECTPLVTGTPMKTDAERYRKAGSVGVPVYSGQIKIEDPDEDGIGEIWFKGPNVMLGYYNMPEETSKVIVDGWFDTGDLGFRDKDGWLSLAGRSKNIIVTKTGKNVYPEELETEINRNDYILESMVYEARKDGEPVVAVQIMPDLAELQDNLGEIPSDEEMYTMFKNIINEFNMTLASYKRIKEIYVRKEDFIRTTTKKVKRAANIEQKRSFDDGEV